MTDPTLETTRVIGQGIPKADAKLKAAGAARYAGDIRPEKHILCGKILYSPYPHARIVSIDTSQAAALKGVYAVVTGQDATPARIGRFLEDRTVLAREKVRCLQEPVAAVAAIDEETAIQALALIRVEYEPLPVVFSPDEALAPNAPILHEDVANYKDKRPSRRVGNQRNLVTHEHGDVEAAFAEADIVVEGTFTTQRVHQGFIEPKACVAKVDKDGKVTIWGSTKAPFLFRTMISRGLGLPLSKIRMISPALGGDFGGKSGPVLEPICALLAVKSGRTVKIALNGQEELATNFVRHPGVTHLKLAARRDGKLLAVEGDVTYDCGAYCDGSNGMAHSCINLQGSYNIPAIRLKGISAFTNNISAGHVRAPGAPQTIFPIECLMDELADKLGIDPVEIRRLNALNIGDPAPGAKRVMGEHGLTATIEKVADYINQNMSERKPNVGVGVACGTWHATGAGGEVGQSKCIVKFNEDGSVTLLTGLSDNGAGQHGMLAQVVAEVLGLDPDEVAVFGGDTELTPADSGPGGSRGTFRVGNTAKFAAEDARRQLLVLAAQKLEANLQDLEIENRQVSVKGSSDRAISLAALAKAASASRRGPIIGTGDAEREEWIAKAEEFANVVDQACFCTHAAQVEVDPETGQVSVLKYVAAQDVGRALNKMQVIGQVEGAVVQGLGYALSEELLVEDGRVTNPTLTNYLMPAADVAPPVDAILVEHPSRLGPFGARGVGEPAITPVAAAIANAVYNAVGVRIRDLPITPEKILRSLKEKEDP